MDQQIVTYAVGLAVVIVLGISYLRFKRHEGESEQESSASIRQTMAETQEYFDMSPQGEDDRFARAFDLMPVKMLSSVFAPADKKRSVRHEKKGRND